MAFYVKESESQEYPSVLKRTQNGRSYPTRWERARNTQGDGEELDRVKHEVNKCLRSISEEARVQFSEETSFGDDLEDKYRTAARLVDKQLERCLKTWKQCKKLDLCFLLDGTGSMGTYINQVKQCIEHLSACLLSKSKRGGGRTLTSIRVGAVVYRDICDEDEFDIIDFTSDMAHFKALCESIRVRGGGDPCEDVFGGMEQALGMAWSPESGTRLLIHMCDSPCHGKKYHGDIDDDYPDGDPLGRKAADLFQKMKDSSIFYYFCKITNHTDIMIEMFAKEANMPISVFDLSNSEKMEMVLNIAVTSSLNKSIIQTTLGGKEQRRQKNYTLSKTRPNWENVKDMVCTIVGYEMPVTIEQITSGFVLVPRRKDDKRVKIATNPFAEGTERIAYYGQLIRRGDTPANAVIKECKYEYPPAVRGKSHEYIKFEQWLESQTIASFLAQKYSAEIQSSHVDIDTEIKYIDTRFLIIEMPGPRLKYYMIEPELQYVAEEDYTPPTYLRTGPEGSGKLVRTPSIVSMCRVYDSLVAVPGEYESVTVVGSSDREKAEKEVFFRITNNADFVVDESRVNNVLSHLEFAMVVAFSHWTYVRTKGYLMVVDLQGALTVNRNTGERCVMLTDPAIHCTDFERFGLTNHGEHGMQMYLQNHQCNEICKALRLPPVNPVDDTRSCTSAATSASSASRFHHAATPTHLFPETHMRPSAKSRSLPNLFDATRSISRHSDSDSYTDRSSTSTSKHRRGKISWMINALKNVFKSKKSNEI